MASTKQRTSDRPEYGSWQAMRYRCLDSRSPRYKYYGGRGIKICDRWLNGDGTSDGFECFLGDMGDRPKGLTLDRIDPDGDYEPGNCRWATHQEQRMGQRHMKEAAARKANRKRGEEHGRSKLTVKQVREIFLDEETSYADLARTYGVVWTTIQRIKNRERWAEFTKDLADEEDERSSSMFMEAVEEARQEGYHRAIEDAAAKAENHKSMGLDFESLEIAEEIRSLKPTNEGK